MGDLRTTRGEPTLTRHERRRRTRRGLGAGLALVAAVTAAGLFIRVDRYILASGYVTTEYYADFAQRVWNVKTKLLSILEDLKKHGQSVAGYGAAAKGNTLMSYVGIDHTTLDYVADKNSFKQGKYYSGMHIPIGPPEWLESRRPDYVLILAWNFAEEIMREQSAYAESGGRFIVPIPEPTLI